MVTDYRSAPSPDRRSIELQEKAALVDSLLGARSTMEQQLGLRDDHIRHLEVPTPGKDLVPHTKAAHAARSRAAAPLYKIVLPHHLCRSSRL
jgi:hypothetical protein